MAEVFRIDEKTYRVEDVFVRWFLLIGKDRAAMIDSGATAPNALEIAKGLTDKPIILLNTHGDGDHTAGTGSFDSIYMHEADFNGCGIGKKFPNVKLSPLHDGDVIDLGGRCLKVIHIPGHTKGSIALLDVNSRSLYAGDSVQKGHIFMFGGHRNPDDFEKSLEKLVSMSSEYDCIYASHDEACIPADYVSKVLAAWRKVRSGEVAFEETDLHGNKVKSYTTETCGFYLA